MTYRCGGTLGDTFINILRLYNQDVDKILHFTKHKEQMAAIGILYSLLGDIEVIEGVGDRNLTFEGYLTDNEPYTAFPKFNLPNIDTFKLPGAYNTVQLQAGVDIRKHPWRFLDKSDISNIPNNKPIVLLGTDNRRLDFDTSYTIIDLRNKTNILESFSVISKSSEFYAPQGLLGFFALSQKVKTTLWLKHNIELRGMAVRIDKIKEWRDYITYINLIR